MSCNCRAVAPVLAVLAVLAAVVPAPAAAAGRTPDPKAGWHGREVRAPLATPREFAEFRADAWPAGWSAGAVQRGTGYVRAGGSDRVREVQERLRRLGYRPGPVDGLFGPRTEGALKWFQIKQGMDADGFVHAATLALLRERTGATTEPASKSTRRSTPEQPEHPATLPAQSQTVALVASETPSWLLVGLIAIATALIALLAWQLWGRRTQAHRQAVMTVPYELWASGVAPDVGRFHGLVQAWSLEEASKPERGRTRTRYLISDPDRQASFWVDSWDVHQFRNGAPSAAPAVTRPAKGIPVLGYVTVPEGERAESARDNGTIEAACQRRGWKLVKLVHDVEGGRSSGRPGLTWALEQLAAGRAAGLVVSKVGHLSRSPSELAHVLPWFLEGRIPLVAVDVEMDTTTPAGRHVAKALITVGLEEQSRLGARTRKGLEAARSNAITAGRAAVRDDPALAEHITALRNEGLSLQAIADRLNEEGVPTLRGGAMWRPSSVQAAVGYKRPSSQSNGITLPAVRSREQSPRKHRRPDPTEPGHGRE
jgi:DNA invertase Pin-like site-specific DNA recombinase